MQFKRNNRIGEQPLVNQLVEENNLTERCEKAENWGNIAHYKIP